MTEPHPHRAAGRQIRSFWALAMVPMLAGLCFALTAVGCKSTGETVENNNRDGNTNTARPVNNNARASANGNNGGSTNAGNNGDQGNLSGNEVFGNGNTAGNTASNTGGSGNASNSNSGNAGNASSNSNSGNASSNNGGGSSNTTTPIDPAFTEEAQTAYQASIRLLRDEQFHAARDLLAPYRAREDEIDPPLAQTIRLMDSRLRLSIDLKEVSVDRASRRRVPVILTTHDDEEIGGWMTAKDFLEYENWGVNPGTSLTIVIRLHAEREEVATIFMRDIKRVMEVKNRDALAEFYNAAAETARNRYLASDRGPIARAWVAFALARWAKLLKSEPMEEEAEGQLNKALIETEPVGVLLDQSLRLAADPEYHEYLADLLTGANAGMQTDRLTTILRRYPHAWQWYEHGIVETRDNRPHFLPKNITEANKQLTDRVFAKIESGLGNIDRAIPPATLGAELDALLASDDLNAILVEANERREAADEADRLAVDYPDNAVDHLDDAIAHFIAARALYKRANQIRSGAYDADVTDMNRSLYWVNMRRPY